MEAGLHYLAGENPGMLDAGATLELWILPIKRSDLQKQIYLQNGSNPAGTENLWPDFGGKESVCELLSVRLKVTT